MNRTPCQHPGLDHVGFLVCDITQLEEWAAHLDSMGAAHSGLVTASYGTALSFKDPDGVALGIFRFDHQASDPSV